jgi:hypothetical protein
VRDDQLRVAAREGHPVGIQRMAPHFGDEAFLVRPAGFEPALALKHPVHDSSARG